MILSKFKKDAILTFSGQILVMICLFVINKILSTFLPVDEFAIYNIIRRSSTIISYVMLGGICIALPRYIALYKSNKASDKVSQTLISGIAYVICNSVIVSILIFVFRNYIGAEITGVGNTSHLSGIVLYSISMAIWSILLAYLRGNDDFIKYNIIQIVSQLILLVPLIQVTRLSIFQIYTWWTCINFTACAIAIALLIKRTYIKNIIPKWNLGQKENVKEIVEYSLPRLFSDLFLFFLPAFPLYYLNRFYSLTDVAYFSVGTSIVTLATPIFSVLGTILLPYVSKNMALKDIGNMVSNIRKLMVYYMICAILITLIFYFFMPYVIRVFFSEQYLASVGLDKILILSVIPEAIYLLYRNPLDAISKIPYNTIILGISCIIFVASFFFLSNLYQFALAYLSTSIFKGLSSYIMWQILIKKYKRNINQYE